MSETLRGLERFTEDVLGVPWGSLSKSEIEFRIFRLLVDEGKIKLEHSDVRIAQQLATTPARVRALRFKIQQREHSTKTEWSWNELLHADIVTLNAARTDGDDLILHVKDPFLKDVLTEKLRDGDRPVLVRSTLTPGHLKVEVVHFWAKIVESSELNTAQLKKLEDGLIAVLPTREKSMLQKVFKAANRGAGAANIASFATSFLAAVSKPSN